MVLADKNNCSLFNMKQENPGRKYCHEYCKGDRILSLLSFWFMQ